MQETDLINKDKNRSHNSFNPDKNRFEFDLKTLIPKTITSCVPYCMFIYNLTVMNIFF